MNKERHIQLSHLPEVDEIDKAKIDSGLAACCDKLQEILNNTVLLKCGFKSYEHGGARKKHEVHLHLSAPGLVIVSSAVGWNLLTALQDAVSKLERETRKRVKE